MCDLNLSLSSPVLVPGQYFASIMIIVGMSVIATVVVLQYHHHDPNGGNMPKWVSVIHHYFKYIITYILNTMQTWLLNLTNGS